MEGKKARVRRVEEAAEKGGRGGRRLTIENGSVVEVLGELLRVQSSTGDDESQLRSESSDILMGRKGEGLKSQRPTRRKGRRWRRKGERTLTNPNKISVLSVLS